MQRIASLTLVAVLAGAATAQAVENTTAYQSKLSYRGTPSAKKPRNLGYVGVLAIDTQPSGLQPDIAPTTTVYFSSAIRQNARRFPSCSRRAIDGQSSFPRRCRAAIVGTGTASAFAGQPGATRSQSIREDLTVRAVNGDRGRQLFLVISSAPGAPVSLVNRVIPGRIVRAHKPFGFGVRFSVPDDLQTQLGLSISLTDFKVTISRRARTIRVRHKRVRASFLQLTKCRRRLPTRAVTVFRDGAGMTRSVTAAGYSRCR